MGEEVILRAELLILVLLTVLHFCHLNLLFGIADRDLRTERTLIINAGDWLGSGLHFAFRQEVIMNRCDLLLLIVWSVAAAESSHFNILILLIYIKLFYFKFKQ